MQPRKSHVPREKEPSLVDENSTIDSDSMSAIYSQDKQKMLQRTKCTEKTVENSTILMDLRSPSALTVDSNADVHNLFGWDFVIPPPPEDNPPPEETRNGHDDSYENEYENFGIERKLVETDKPSTGGRKMQVFSGKLRVESPIVVPKVQEFRGRSRIESPIDGSKMRMFGRILSRPGRAFPADRHRGNMVGGTSLENLVDMDEVSLSVVGSVARQTSCCNIDSLIGLDNLCNCFYGKYDKDLDYGNDGNAVDYGDNRSRIIGSAAMSGAETTASKDQSAVDYGEGYEVMYPPIERTHRGTMERKPLEAMQPPKSHVPMEKEPSLVDENSTIDSSVYTGIDSMSAIYSQDEQKMLQRTICAEKTLENSTILMDLRSPSALTVDSTDDVHNLFGWDFVIPPPPEDNPPPEETRNGHDDSYENEYENFGIERKLVETHKPSNGGRKMQVFSGKLRVESPIVGPKVQDFRGRSRIESPIVGSKMRMFGRILSRPGRAFPADSHRGNMVGGTS
jgi:hypothetical protein